MQLSSSLMRRLRREDGGMAVQFTIIFSIMMVLVFGVIDFGHASYMRDLMSDASLTDARYATRYKTDASGHRILPKNISHSVSNYVINTSGLRARLPDGTLPRVLAAVKPCLVKTTMSRSTQPGGGKFGVLAPPKLEK